MENKEISIRKAAIIGLITAVILLVIGISLALICLAITGGFIWHGQNTIIGKMFFGIISSMFGGAVSVMVVITRDFLYINNVVVDISISLGGQGLLGAVIGMLLAIISKKSRQLKAIWFGVRVAEVLMIIGIILVWIFMPNVS